MTITADRLRRFMTDDPHPDDVGRPFREMFLAAAILIDRQAEALKALDSQPEGTVAEQVGLEPCLFCGAVPSPDPGLTGVPESGGFVACATIHIEGGRNAPCPAWADDGETWNYLMRMARSRLAEERTQG